MIRWLIKINQLDRSKRMSNFTQSACQPHQVQSRVLIEKIRRNQQTEFGRRHRFSSIHSIEGFRRAIPLSTYEDFRPYVERMVEGETNLLFDHKDKLLMFALTSGTTGRPKMIPVPETFVREYEDASRLWNSFCLKDHPRMLDGKILPVVSSGCDTVTCRGVPVGSISSLVSARQKALVRHLYAVPPGVANIRNADARYYTIMRLAVATSVSFISTANPSTLLLLARLVDQRKHEVIRDLYDGTLSVRAELSKDVLDCIQPFLKPNPKRARQIEARMKLNDCLYPKDYWPELALISCWKGGPLRLFQDSLADYYGNVPVRDLGLLASEGRFTIPISDEEGAGVLNIVSNFYEFLPAEEDDPVPDTPTLLAHELMVGQEYFLVLTSSSGLYRYQIHDLVRVEGVYRSTPIISFLNKGRHIASITGEKVSEYQLVTAFKQAFKRAIPPPFFACPAWDVTPYYTLVIEEADFVQTALWEPLLEAMDLCLQRLNCEYASKRSSGRLGSIQLTVVPTGSLESNGPSHGQTEQHKPVYLRTEVDYYKRFPTLSRVKTGGPIGKPRKLSQLEEALRA